MHYPDSNYAWKNFEQTLKVSDNNTNEFYTPKIVDAGFSVGSKQDAERIQLSKVEQENYINPNDDNAYAGIRSPDLLALCPFSSLIRLVFFEIKDFPRLGIYAMTGFPIKLIMRYIALQHLYKIPIIILFRDFYRPPSGNIPGLLSSPYGFNIPYGGLLWDLPISTTKSWVIAHKPPRSGRQYPQILWETEDSKRNAKMLTIYEIAEKFKQGLVKMKTINPLDPKEGELWRITNNKTRIKSIKQDYAQVQPMTVPENGLNIFTIF